LAKDEKEVIALESKNVYTKEIGLKKGEEVNNLTLYKFFVNRVRDCLHIVMSFSPVGPHFRERNRNFPALFSSCTVDWYLPWPEEALVSVSQNFLGEFEIDVGGKEQVKQEIQNHMGKVHQMVTEVCLLYYERMRRHVYVTPKSYLSFINMYKEVYKVKYDELNKEEENIRKGLRNVAEATEDISEMKKVLEVKKKEQAIAAEATQKLMDKLSVENAKAAKKEEEVNKVKEGCLSEAAKIEVEKAEAEADLAVAMPFLEKAVAAADSIESNDVKELRGNNKPVDTTKIIMDAVNIIFNLPIAPISMGDKKIGKN
jgi:dynein heavy chain